MKCPSCGHGFHGANSNSSFNAPAQTSASQAVANNSSIGQTQQPSGSLNNSTSLLSVDYASFWMRFLAILIDACILIVPAMILGALIGVLGMLWDDTDYITTLKIQFVCFALGILYEAIFISSHWQATPGKRLLGIKVTDMSGNPISFWRAVGRAAGKLISSIFFIGYIMAAFTRHKQALHDLMAGTIVTKG